MHVGMKYVDKKNRTIQVAKTSGGKFAVVFLTKTGKESNLNHEDCPTVPTKEECQNNLDAAAKKQGWPAALLVSIKAGDHFMGPAEAEDIPVKLTDADRLDRSIAQQELGNDIDRIQKERADMNASYKKVIKEKVKQIAELRPVIHDGIENQTVMGSWEPDVDCGLMVFVQHDPLRILKWRVMTEEEAQMDNGLTKDAPAAKPSGEDEAEGVDEPAVEEKAEEPEAVAT